MTTTTISTATDTHRMSALVRDAFHVRTWLTHSEVEPQHAVSSPVPAPRKPAHDQDAVLSTFAGRYGARY